MLSYLLSAKYVHGVFNLLLQIGTIQKPFENHLPNKIVSRESIEIINRKLNVTFPQIFVGHAGIVNISFEGNVRAFINVISQTNWNIMIFHHICDDLPENKSLIEYRSQIFPVHFRLELFLSVRQKVDFNVRIATSGYVFDWQATCLQHLWNNYMDARWLDCSYLAEKKTQKSSIKKVPVCLYRVRWIVFTVTIQCKLLWASIDLVQLNEKLGWVNIWSAKFIFVYRGKIINCIIESPSFCTFVS